MPPAIPTFEEFLRKKVTESASSGGPSTGLAAPIPQTRWGDTIGSVNAVPGLKRYMDQKRYTPDTLWQETPTYNMLNEGGTAPVFDSAGDLTSIINGKKMAYQSPNNSGADKPMYGDPAGYGFRTMTTETGAGGPNTMGLLNTLMASKADGSFAYSKPFEDGFGLDGIEPHRYDGPPAGLEEHVKAYRESTEKGNTRRPITELDIIRSPWIRDLHNTLASSLYGTRITGIDENGNIHTTDKYDKEGMFLAPENASTEYAGYNNKLKSGHKDGDGLWTGSPYLAAMPYTPPVLGENEDYLYTPRAEIKRGGRRQVAGGSGKREK